MPWREVNPMDEKVLFIADCLRAEESFSSICRRYGISRKTGYKWMARYKESGLSGLTDKSRKPHSHPATTPYAMRKAILEHRRIGCITLGPKKISALLIDKYGDATDVPSITTIHKILDDAGEIKKQKKRSRVAANMKRTGQGQHPNDLWTADYKGQFMVGKQSWCYPLTIMDDSSRYLLGCKGLQNTGRVDAQREFMRLFQKYGLPRRILTDNGSPFASTAAGGLSRLSIWWIKLGIIPQRIEKGKPQQNGRHERMHLTLKRAVASPPAKTFKEQQHRLDEFVSGYNELRPHEALDQQPPSTCYTHSPRPYPKRLAPVEYPSYFRRRPVHTNGVISWHNTMIYVAHVLRKEEVGICELDDGVWGIFFGPVLLGKFDERDIGRGSTSYIRMKKV